MRDMQASARHTVRLISTWALLFVLVWFAGLALFDRLSYTQPSEYQLLHLAADSNLWGWLFGFTGLVLVAVLLGHPTRHHVAMSRTCSVAAAFLGTWAFFTLLWGVTAVTPVSLAVFGPAVFSVVGAQVLAVSWRRKE